MIEKCYLSHLHCSNVEDFINELERVYKDVFIFERLKIRQLSDNSYDTTVMKHLITTKVYFSSKFFILLENGCNLNYDIFRYELYEASLFNYELKTREIVIIIKRDPVEGYDWYNKGNYIDTIRKISKENEECHDYHLYKKGLDISVVKMKCFKENDIYILKYI